MKPLVRVTLDGLELVATRYHLFQSLQVTPAGQQVLHAMEW